MSKDVEIELLDDSTFESYVGEGVVLVDFFAEWCGPCRMLGPILAKVAEELSGKARIAKVDIDQAPDVTKNQRIMSVPTLILFKDGAEVERIVGLKDADALTSMVTNQL